MEHFIRSKLDKTFLNNIIYYIRNFLWETG